MKTVQYTLDEFLTLLRRRKTALLIPILLVTGICSVGAFLMPKKYASSTTILVQGEKVLNPLVSYTMAVSMESDDRLRNFNEIIYSRPMIESLVDSLRLQPAGLSPAQRDQQFAEVSGNIKTATKSSDSFSLEYYDTDPVRARNAVTILASLFIQTRLRVENSKNDFAVQFFRRTLDSLREKFEQSQQLLVSTLKRHSTQLSDDDKLVYSHIDDYDTQINSLQRTVSNYERALTILKESSANGTDRLDLNGLYGIPLLEVPYAAALQTAFTKYDEISQRYTQQYPSVQEARTQVLQLMDRVKSAITSDLASKQSQIWDLERQRNQAISTVQQATIARNQNQDVQSTFNIYHELYDNMKIKLEQAQTNRELGENGGREFVVVDPPEIPTHPARPNVPLIIGGGFSVSLILGVLTACLAELLDPRIHAPMEIELYNRPIVAFLPAPDSRHH